jgi:small subunit ribosomal protein S9
MTEEKQEKNLESIDDSSKFKGRYVEAVGRRKTAIARVRLYTTGKGALVLNNQPIKKYLIPDLLAIATSSLKLVGKLRDYDISIMVSGGGKKAQAEAIRHGITRCLIACEKELKPALKVKGYLTRDPRKKERKKPGLKRARRAPQWAKR